MTIALPATGSPNLALFMAYMVRNLRSDTPKDALDNLFSFWTDKRNASLYVPLDDTCPAYYVADSGLDTIVVIDGASVIGHAVGLVAGWAGGPRDSVSDPENSFVSTAAGKVVNSLMTLGLQRNYRISFGGWSFGGAIAEASMKEIALRGIGWTGINSTTFGSPRWTGEGITRNAGGLARTWRIMNTGDPVPSLPPTAEACSLCVAFFGIRGAQRASNFYHSSGGSVIDENGVFTGGVEPADATPNFTASLANWILSKDETGDNLHGITTYVNRLQLAVARLDQTHTGGATAVQPPAQIAVRPERRTPTGRAGVTVAERRTEQIVVNLQRQQNSTPVVIPDSLRFKALRVGRLWFVFFGATQITMTANKRSARRFARLGNALLRDAQNKPGFDATAFMNAFQAYLTQAQQPGGGFSPLMATVLPLQP